MGHAAGERAPEQAVAVRSHDDHVGLLALGRLDDLGGVGADHPRGAVGQLVLVEELLDRVQHLGRLVAVVILHGAGAHQGLHPRRQRRLDVEHHHFAILVQHRFVGHQEGEGLLREFAAVGGEKNLHGELRFLKLGSTASSRNDCRKVKVGLRCRR
jgi:hypothetical protein